MKNAIESLRKDIGSNGFHNYIVFEEKVNPLQIGDVTINRSFYIQLQNMNLLGIQNFIVDKLRINLENFKVNRFY